MASGEGILFDVLSGRARWLAQRQSLLAQNVANADTPGYRPLDLREAAFGDLVKRGLGGASPLGAARTHGAHIEVSAGPRAGESGRPVDGFEAAPSGNEVVLPEQLEKMAHTQLDYELSTNLYRRYVGLFRQALGTGQS